MYVESFPRCISLMNEYWLFDFYAKKIVLNIPITRMEGKMQFLEQQNQLFTLQYFTLSQLETNNYGVDLSKMAPLPCSSTELHITKAVDYTDLFIGIIRQ